MKKCIAALGIGAVAISMSLVEASAMEKVVVTASTLNIRSGPSTSYSVIDKVNKGQSLELLEKGNGWNKVKLSNGNVGWASAQYISIGQNNGSSSTQISNKKGTVKASSLNVRSGSGTNYSIISKISNGTTVDLLEKSNNGWYKIKLSNGTIGWVSDKYILENTSTSENPSTEANKNPEITNLDGKKAKVTANSLNVRSGAGTNYSVISKLNNGKIVKLLAKASNGWYKIEMSNGTIGWVAGSFLVETNESASNNNPNTSVSSNRQELIKFAREQMGKTYEWGATGPNRFDCSGFTQYVYRQVEGKSIPRVSREQAKYGVEVAKGNYLPGDLVYFDTSGDGNVSHVGIYIGSNEFIHCSGTSSKPDKVKISNLGTGYYAKALKGARRF